jgi:pimeloyl-ACP methyl ester carboxylesterase
VHITSMLIASGTALLAAMTPAAPARAADPIRNIVLVHGAYADGSGWQPVFERLVKKGYRVSIVQEPETSLEDDVAATRRVIDMQDGPVVLVGHSWGGQIITEAGADEKVKALVYIAALVPDVGESTASLQARIPPASKAIGPAPDGFLIIDPKQFHEDFAGDLTEEQASFMAASQVLISQKAVETPAKAAAWKTKPTYGIVATKDRTINPDLERWMYDRAKAKITEIDSSHVVMISHPDKVAAVIEQAAGR